MKPFLPCIVSMATPSFFNDHCPCVRMALPSVCIATDSQCLLCLNSFAIAKKAMPLFLNGFTPRNSTISRGFTCLGLRLCLFWKRFCLSEVAHTCLATKGYASFWEWFCPLKRYRFQGFTCHGMMAIPFLGNSFASQMKRIPPIQ